MWKEPYVYKTFVWWMVHEILHQYSGCGWVRKYTPGSTYRYAEPKKMSLLSAFGVRRTRIDNAKYAIQRVKILEGTTRI